MKNKINQSDADFIYRSEFADKKLEKMSIEECRELFRIKPTYLTLEDIKEEWKKEGFEIISCTKERFEAYKQWINKINGFKIPTDTEIIINGNYFHINGNFPNKYTQLLIKTFRALRKL